MRVALYLTAAAAGTALLWLDVVFGLRGHLAVAALTLIVFAWSALRLGGAVEPETVLAVLASVVLTAVFWTVKRFWSGGRGAGDRSGHRSL